MKVKVPLFVIVALTDLVLAGKGHGSNGIWSVIGALAIAITLIWFGDLWNILFPPGVLSVEHPIITRETPQALLELSAWVIVTVVTLLVVFI